MKRTLATLALTCALSVPVMAGEIPTCGCKSIKDKTPTVPAPVTTESGVDSTSEFSETEASVLLTVILTLISLVDR